jgi:hypothetical protein
MLDKARELIHLDFAPEHEQPSAGRVLLAVVVSVAGSLLADALLVVIAQAVFPGIRGYAHFQFGDYAKLTVIGVLIGCAAWPVTTRITSQPRWMFLRMAALVTLVLWLPDVYILAKGQPAKAVAFLFVMHLAIALVTYNALVHLAPVRTRHRAAHRRAQPASSNVDLPERRSLSAPNRIPRTSVCIAWCQQSTQDQRVEFDRLGQARPPESWRRFSP